MTGSQMTFYKAAGFYLAYIPHMYYFIRNFTIITKGINY